MIQVSHLSKSFDNRGIAGLHNLSFSLSEGKVMAIMGPNGSGKTTLLKIIQGELPSDGGAVSLNGNVCLFDSSKTQENKNVQRYLIDSITLQIDEEKKLQLTRDLADTFEFTFQLRQNLMELSSGQKQKVLLAKELINRPKVLLMDEPFAHLDPYTRKDILKGLFEYIRQQQITVLWVTHDLEEAFQFSDAIGLMNFGKFEQLGTPEELVRTPKNLFAAKYVGLRNFFPTKWGNGAWTTPWGTMKRPALPTADGILIIPDFSWKQSSEGLPFKVLTRHAGRQIMEYSLSHDSRTIYLVKGTQEDLLDIGSEIRLIPCWEECLHIPL